MEINVSFSYTRQTASGSTDTFAFTFGYLSSAHIGVSVDGTPVAFTFLDSFTVKVSAGNPTAGSVVEVRRTTPMDEVAVDYVDGAVLTESDLDTDALFSLYIAQETYDIASTTVQLDAFNMWDGQGRIARNFADPEEATDLVTLGYLEDGYVPAIEAAVAAAEASAVAADASADIAADALDSFKSVYQGGLPAAPTTRYDGSPLQEGDLYYDTVTDRMRVWTAGSWADTGSVIAGTINKPASPVIATAGQTIVPVPGGYEPGFITVFLNGSLMDVPDITTTSGTDIVFTAPLALNDEVTWVAYGIFEVANHPTYAEAVISLDSVAAIRASAPLTCTRVATKGYSTAGDGGSAQYYLDAADTTTADDGFLCIVDASSRRWKLDAPRGWVSVLWAGADPTAAVPSTAAFNKCTATGKTTKVPRGAYLIDGTVSFTGNIEGDGRDDTQIYVPASSSFNVFVNASGGFGPTVKGLYIGVAGGGFRAGGVTITMDGPAGNMMYLPAIRDCTFQNQWRCIDLLKCNAATVEDNFFVDHRSTAVFVSNTEYPDNGDHSIEGNTFDTTATTVVHVVQNNAGGIRILNNKGGRGSGFYLNEFDGIADTSILVFTGNSIENQINFGVKLRRLAGSAIFYYVIIDGNEFSMAAPTDGIVNLGGAMFKQNIVTNNVFHIGGLGDCLVTGQATGVLVDANVFESTNVSARAIVAIAGAAGRIGATNIYDGFTAPIVNAAPLMMLDTSTQIGAATVTTTGGYGSLFAGTVAVVFPKPFQSIPTVTFNPGGANFISAKAESITKVGFTLRVFGAITADTGDVTWVAHGVL